MKSRNPLWNPEIHLKSRNPLWNPEIHFEIQKSILKSEIQWISKSRMPIEARRGGPSALYEHCKWGIYGKVGNFLVNYFARWKFFSWTVSRYVTASSVNSQQLCCSSWPPQHFLAPVDNLVPYQWRLFKSPYIHMLQSFSKFSLAKFSADSGSHTDSHY